MIAHVNSSLRSRKILVGLSGGVDSSVTAALLQRAGAQIEGAFFKGWYPPGMPCSWAEDRRDAMRVAAHLRIPFRTIDASHAYRRGVIEYLLREYKAGRTPNPDVMCNREVKFGVCWEDAKRAGCDALATGHYARTQGGSLYRGRDTHKDQSYFLWAVPSSTLAHVVFPVGEYTKEEVRRLAKEFRLPTATKKDSQGICFLGSISVDEFLKAEFGTERGVAVDESGREVGTHDGVVLYTLGERVALSGGPWYVRAKDILHNRLVVSKERTVVSEDTIRFSDENFFTTEREEYACSAQLRYHGPLVPGVVSRTQRTFTPHAALTEAAASGQSIVFYDGDEVRGGGIIT